MPQKKEPPISTSDCLTFDKFGAYYKTALDRVVEFSGEDSEYFASYKAGCIKKFLGPNFKGRILDYGCGIGLVAKQLRICFGSEDTKIFGYDISNISINEARKNVDNVIFMDDFTGVADKEFDVIIIANVLHHIEASKRSELVKMLKNVLKKDGYIFIFEHNPYNPVTQSVVKNFPPDKDAVLLYPDKTARLVREAGYTLIKKDYIVFFPRIFKFMRFAEPLLAGIPLGAQYMHVGQLPG